MFKFTPAPGSRRKMIINYILFFTIWKEKTYKIFKLQAKLAFTFEFLNKFVC